MGRTGRCTRVHPCVLAKTRSARDTASDMFALDSTLLKSGSQDEQTASDHAEGREDAVDGVVLYVALALAPPHPPDCR